MGRNYSICLAIFIEIVFFPLILLDVQYTGH